MKLCSNPGGLALYSNSLINSESCQLISIKQIKFLKYDIDPLSFSTEGHHATWGNLAMSGHMFDCHYGEEVAIGS